MLVLNALLLFPCLAMADQPVPRSFSEGEWRHIVTMKDGCTWRCYPPSRTSAGRLVYRCYNTRSSYTYEAETPLSEKSLKRERERGGLFYELYYAD